MRGVNIHGKTLRLHFKLPGEKKFTKKTTGLSVTKNNIALAQRKLAALELDIQAGIYAVDQKIFWQKHFPTNNEYITPNYTLKAYYDRYRLLRSGQLSFSSEVKINSSESFLQKHGLLNSDVNKISYADIEIIRNKALKTIKPSTLTEYFSVLRRVLDEAEKENTIAFNPFLKVRKLKQEVDSTEEKKVFPFTQTELSRLLAVVHVSQTRDMIEFLAWTGMRPGEMKALAWEDIDLEQGLIKVRFSLDREGKLKPPKTSAGIRTIELMPLALNILKRQREKTFMQNTIEETVHFKFGKTKRISRRRVFLSRDNTPYIRPELCTATRQWSDWLKKAKLINRPPYQLRHTFASQLLTAGAEPMWLAKQLGHSDWGMIRKIYGHWITEERPDHRLEIAKKLGQHDPNMTHTEQAKLN
jgi:integrase